MSILCACRGCACLKAACGALHNSGDGHGSCNGASSRHVQVRLPYLGFEGALAAGRKRRVMHSKVKAKVLALGRPATCPLSMVLVIVLAYGQHRKAFLF